MSLKIKSFYQDRYWFPFGPMCIHSITTWERRWRARRRRWDFYIIRLSYYLWMRFFSSFGTSSLSLGPQLGPIVVSARDKIYLQLPRRHKLLTLNGPSSSSSSSKAFGRLYDERANKQIDRRAGRWSVLVRHIYPHTGQQCDEKMKKETHINVIWLIVW